jgi:hypothetical protein
MKKRSNSTKKKEKSFPQMNNNSNRDKNKSVDKKKQINDHIDYAFDNKEIVKEIIDSSKDEDLKFAGNLALKDKKLTKDVANFCLDEQENPSDEKNQINKGLDIAFDNKETVKEIIDSSKDKNLKFAGNLALKDKKLTKDVANFALDQGEILQEKFENFSQNKEMKTSDYLEFASDNLTQVNKAMNILFDNKNTIKKMNDDQETDLNLALNHENLTRGFAHLALKDRANFPKQIEEFSEKKDQDVYDYAKFISRNNQDILQASRILNQNKYEVNDMIDTCFEDRETKETLKEVVNNYDLEGLATAVIIGANVVDFFSNCSIF